MPSSQVIEHIRERCALPDGPAASVAAETTLAALGRGLDRKVAKDVAAHLPEPWSRALVRGASEGAEAPALEEVYDELAESLVLTRGAAAEVVEVTVSELARAAGPDDSRRMRLDLPESWGSLLTPPESAPGRRRAGLSGAPPHSGSPARGGPQGFKRSLATSGPREDTVAEDRPGADEPLSEGQPGSHHPLSEGR